MTQPLILITNDDGILSPGLRAAAEACAPLGDLLIVAPMYQQTATGRSKSISASGRIELQELCINGQMMAGYGVDGTPAQQVEHAIFELLETHGETRKFSLVVSGINFGENLGESITVSGTVGAALEAASWGIPAIAASRQTDPEHYFTHNEAIDFAVAGHFLQRVVKQVLNEGLPKGADLLKMDVPEDAKVDTPMRWTRVSRQRYFVPVLLRRRTAWGDLSPLGFERRIDPALFEPDSDVYAVVVDKVVSLSPISTDMTATVEMSQLSKLSSK